MSTVQLGFWDTIFVAYDHIAQKSWAMTPFWNRLLTSAGIVVSIYISIFEKNPSSQLIKITLYIFFLGLFCSYFLNNILNDIYLITLVGINLLLYARATTYLADFLLQSFRNSFSAHHTLKFWILLIASIAICVTTISYFDALIGKGYFSQHIQSSSMYGDIELTAFAIHNDRLALKSASVQNYDFFTLAGLTAFRGGYYGRDGWPSSSQWLILEEVSKTQLVRITDSRNIGAQFRPIQTNISAIYLTCFYNQKTPQFTLLDQKKNCISMFLASRPNLNNDYRDVYSNERLVVMYFERNRSTDKSITTDEIVRE